MQNMIPLWRPGNLPIYDVNKSYLENADQGPFFDGPYPERPKGHSNLPLDFLGFPLASPIGIAAGPLLNARWIRLAADLGYDLLWYKTIRSSAHPGHPCPNIVYVQAEEQIKPGQQGVLAQAKHSPRHLEELAITNSFGMPSRDPEYLKKDIALANSYLHEGQVMIVSVVGTCKGDNREAFIQDFADAACLAKECGAKVIEANFSCPNVAKGEGSIYLHPDSVYEIASRIKKAIGTTPLMLKFGVFNDQKVMGETLIKAANAGVQAISGINTISMTVVDEAKNFALGPERPTSGICGAPIRQAALDFVRKAWAINAWEGLNLKIVGGGGITLPEHFDEFLGKAGADIAVCATAMMWDPLIAMRYHANKLNGNKE